MLPIQTLDNLFKDGVPGGDLGTPVTSAWLNGVQAEINALAVALGLPLTTNNNDLMRAILSRVGSAGGMFLRNLLINAAGMIIQRGYVSGTPTTVANQYTSDRWRVVVAGQSLSWVANGAYMTFTAPAGGVEQVIEGLNILGGTYVLNWVGTATATVNGVAVVKGGTVALPANTSATVRFIGGTFSQPQFELGNAPTAFELRPWGLELQLCQRYYEKTFSQGVAPANGIGANGSCLMSIVYQGQTNSSSQPLAQWQFKVEKRIPPAIQLFNPGVIGSAGQWANGSASAASSNARCLASSTRGASFDNSDTGIGAQTWYLHATADAEL